MKPLLLDLFCCEGGAARGYAKAGFRIEGVDLNRAVARRYPFTFHFGDALAFVREHGHRFDAIHASPPCQAYSSLAATLTPRQLANYPKLVEPVREALEATGKPYIIENVVGAPLRDPVLLCGSMFGLSAPDVDGTPLRLERHRLFESNVPLRQPPVHSHDPRVAVAGIYGGGASRRGTANPANRGGYTPVLRVRQQLMGVRHMTQLGLSEAIPPAYTEYLGAQLLEHLNVELPAANSA
ncbi:DNA methylase [Arthrobacter phage SilentRX]|uniref:DNA methyltransferase n=1 Tax=Arthrobacter phage SilentRX TaxID=2836091 RepID=A0A8F3EA61_9CAUD|nr:DNA methylase [Arthrobacter phage SilentRX]QWY82843.1 DNA methyltransferase [Arthrobacter phage SilentRX]